MVSFLNSFMSYVMLMLVIVAVAACGFLLGYFLRKKKNIEIAEEEKELAEE